jgi:hypothetical protein
MTAHQVRALLMGGQACVFYGAAEFSRDVDLAIVADSANLTRLEGALGELMAEPVFVPPLKAEFLERGHAIHFRCQHPEAKNLRVDLMARMRGVAPFPELWERRTTVTDADGMAYELLSLPDLVQAKKTQRDKDWPMIRRLVEADYAAAGGEAEESRVAFWLRELRTPRLLIEIARQHTGLCVRLKPQRLLLGFAAANKPQELADALEAEEKYERELDRNFWQPLKAELESLRHGGRQG